MLNDFAKNNINTLITTPSNKKCWYHHHTTSNYRFHRATITVAKLQRSVKRGRYRSVNITISHNLLLFTTMEEVMNALKNIQRELDEQKNTILKNGERVTEQVTQNINCILEEKFKILDDKYENLKEKIDNQEKRLYFIEKQLRKNNVVFFGLEETEISYSDLEKNIINFIKERFSINLDLRDIQEIKRIGKKGERPRPIIVTFTTLGTKINIFKRSTLLKNTSYYIKEDYPQNILERRKELQEQAQIEKEKGNSVIIKYDKLIVLGKKNKTTKNKRMLSTSPETNIEGGDETRMQINKKNKTQNPNIQTARKKSFSQSEDIVKPGILNFLTTKNHNNSQGKKDNNKERI